MYSITIQKLLCPRSKSELKREPTSQVGVGRGPQGRTQHPVNSKPLLIDLRVEAEVGAEVGEDGVL